MQPYYNDEGKYLAMELGQGTFAIKVEDTGIRVGEETYTQQNTEDDLVTISQYISPPGNFTNTIWYTDGIPGGWRNVHGVNDVGDGDDYSVVGSTNLGATCGFYYDPDGEPNNRMVASNTLLKFDGSALRIRENSIVQNEKHEDTVSVYYGYLEGYRNWESDDELRAATEGSLNWVPAESADLNQRYVAVLIERRGLVNTISRVRSIYGVYFEARTDAKPGQVYMITERTKLWTDGQKISPDKIPSAGSSVSLSEEAYPKALHGEIWDYHKVTYSEKGYDGNHKGGNRYGDSLLLLAYTSKIEMSVAQQWNNAPKKDFNLDKGERTADFVMTPSLVMEHELVQGEHATTTTVTIETTLPEGLSYIQGSAYQGGTYTQSEEAGKQGTVTDGVQFKDVSSQEAFNSETKDPVVLVEKDAEGKTKLTFRFFNVPIKSGPAGNKIYFSTTIGNEADSTKDLANGAQPVIEARISTTEDNQRRFKLENGNLTNAGIHVTKLGAMAFSKTAVKELNEITDDLSWNLSWNNNGSSTSTEPVTLLDTMPLNGDAHGSSYAGSYKIKSWKMNPEAAGGTSGFTVYYTTDPKYQNYVLTSGAGGDGKITWDEVKTWKTLPINNQDGSVDFSKVSGFVYAWAIGGELEGGRSLQIGITVHQNTAAGGDVLVNTASTGLFTRSAPVRRVQRSISGYVWLDEDSNGRMDIQEGSVQSQNEKYMKNVTVSLQRKQNDGTWIPATDLKGKEKEIKTGDDGYYCFSDLQPGTYRVLFSGGKTKDYETTVCRAAGVVSARNSKAEAPDTEEASAGAKAVIRNLVLPEAEKLSVGIYNLPNQNAGFSRSVDMAVTKAWAYIDENDPNNNEGTYLPKPESVRVNLYKKNEGGSKTLVRSIELKKADNWSGIFEKLPAEESGETIDYTSDKYELEEVKADGYTPVIGRITKNTDPGYTVAITNNAKFRDAYEPVSLAIQKYRKGDKKNVAGVTFSLQKQGETDKTDITTDDSGKASFSFEPDDTWKNETIYTLTEKSAPAGYTPSSATWTVTVTRNAEPVVTVNDQKDGFIRTWEYTVTVTPETGSDSSFNKKENCLTVYNPYEAEGKLDIPVKKTVSGISVEQAVDKTFSFELYKANENYEYTDKDLLQTKQIKIGADGTGSETFKLEYGLVSADYSMQGDVGTHYYVVKEKTTDLPAGFTRDEREYRLKVTVTDNGNGTLTSEKKVSVYKPTASQTSASEILNANDQLSFDNHYAASGTVEVSGRKTVTGNNLSAFRFGIFTDEQGTIPVSDGTVVLEDGTEGGTSVPNSAENGSFQFAFQYDMEDLKETVGGKEVYQKEKTFTYYIKETSEESECPGYTLDESVYKVDVTVTDQGNGVLDTVVGLSKRGKGEAGFTTGAGMTTAEFVNTYAASATTRVTGQKTVEGGQLKAFTFQIESADDKGLANVVNASVTNDASSGEFQFDFQYDMNALKYYEDTDTEKTNPKYKDSDSFSYLIKEDSSKNPSGYTGSGEIYRVVVTVEHNGKGTMTASPVVSKLKAGIAAGDVNVTNEAQWENVLDSVTSFVNRYETGTTQVTVDGTKSIKGANIKAFNFGIYTDTDCKIPVETWDSVKGTGCVEAQTVQNAIALSAGGTYDFHFVLHYTQESLKNAGGSYAVEKVFTYYVKETSADTVGSKGYKTDDKIYQVNVKVTDNQDGTISAVVASVKLLGTSGEYTEEVSAHVLSFANAYSAEGDAEINGQKTVVNANLSSFTFGIYTNEECTQPAPVKNVNQTAGSSAQTGAFKFNFAYTMDDLKDGESYKDQDTFTYYVKETNQKPGYAENTMVYRVAVTVSNATDNGELTVTPKITGVKEDNGVFRTENLPTALEFTNIYQAAAQVTVSGTKAVDRAQWNEVKTTPFTFRLYEGENARLAENGWSDQNPTARTTANSVQNDSEGEFTFDLHFTMEDLKETAGYTEEKDFIFYVKEEDVPAGYENAGNVYYELKCHVADDGEGELDAALTELYRCSTDAEGTVTKSENLIQGSVVPDAAFVNTRKSSGKAELNISKTLAGNRSNGIAQDEFKFTATELTAESDAEKNDGTLDVTKLTAETGAGTWSGSTAAATDPDQNGDYHSTAPIIISYTQENLGADGTAVFWYRLTENNGTDVSVSKDDAVFYAKIIVANNYNKAAENGAYALDTTVTYYDSNGRRLNENAVPSYINHYRAAVGLTIPVRKYVSGISAEKAENKNFTFELYHAVADKEGNYVEKGSAIQTATVTIGREGSGEGNFAPLGYSTDPDAVNVEGSVGTYHYIVKESATTGGFSRDTKKYHVQVTVEDGGSGNLNCTAVVDNENRNLEEAPLEFTNTYTANGSVTIQGTKRAEHAVWADLEEKAFTFKLYEGTPTTLATDGFSTENPTARTTANSVQNDSKGDFAFDLHFTMEDLEVHGNSEKPEEVTGYAVSKDFSFYVKEENVPAGYENAENVYYKLTCQVTDNGDGTLTPTLTGMYRCENGSENTEAEAGMYPGFVNKYLSDGSVTLNISKTLTGNRKNSIEAGEFVFTAKQMEGTGVENPDGTMNPGSLKPVDPEISYSGDVQEKETAEENGDYVTSAAIKLEYTQDDMDEEGNGTFWYLLTEDDILENTSVEKDNAAFYAKVSLSNDTDQTLNAADHHKLAASVIWYDEGGKKLSEGSNPSFENRYKAAGNAEIEANKELTGGRVLPIQHGEFEFTATLEKILKSDGTELDEVVGTEQEMVEGSVLEGTVDMAVGTNTAEAVFAKVSYDEDAIGKTYVYELREKNGSMQHIEYSDQIFYAAVTVSDSGEIENGVGVLNTDVSYYSDASLTQPVDEAVFVNDYSASGSEAIPVSKVLTGRDWLDTDTFDFTLTETTEDDSIADRLEKASVTTVTKENQEASFVLNYTKPGTHTYRIAESSVDGNGISVDKSVYTATVVVTDDQQGTLHAKTTLVKTEEGKEETADNVVFTNHYHAEGSVILEGTKRLTGNRHLPMMDDEFTFEVTENGRVASHGSVKSDGTIAFEPITYTEKELGVHTYEVREIAGKDQNITYSSQVIEVKVTVTDKADGTLDAKADYPLGGISFENRYTERVQSSIHVTKHLTSNGAGLIPTDQTFYTALFSDEELQHRVSDVKALVFQNTSSSTVTFDDLATGTTYYVAETDISGTAIPSGLLPTGELYEAVFPNGNKVQLGENGGEVEFYFENAFPIVPGGFYKEAELTITKRLISSSGEDINSNETFYAGIFEDEQHTVLSSRVPENIIALNMNGGSESSEVIIVSFDDGGSQKLYVTEVDANGKPVADAPDFEYEVSVDKASVTLSEENYSDSVTITNKEKTETKTKSEDEMETEESKKSGKSVKTGDETPVEMYMLLLLAAAAALVVLGYRKKRIRK